MTAAVVAVTAAVITTATITIMTISIAIVIAITPLSDTPCDGTPFGDAAPPPNVPLQLDEMSLHTRLQHHQLVGPSVQLCIQF